MSDSDFTYTVASNGENKVLPEKDFENGMFKNGSLSHTGGEAVGEHDFSITNLASNNSNYSVTMEENAPKFTITKKSLKDKDIVAVNYDEKGNPIDTDKDGKFEYEYTGSVNLTHQEISLQGVILHLESQRMIMLYQEKQQEKRFLVKIIHMRSHIEVREIILIQQQLNGKSQRASLTVNLLRTKVHTMARNMKLS